MATNWAREYTTIKKEQRRIVVPLRDAQWCAKSRNRTVDELFSPVDEPVTHGWRRDSLGYARWTKFEPKEREARPKAPRFSKAELRSIFTEARAKATQAAKEAVCTPMVVQQRESPLDDSSRVTKEWVVPDGPCGFAWVEIRPGNSSAANYAKKHNLGRYCDYYKAVLVSPDLMTQSITRKESWARAFASVLCAHGINAHVGSRLD